MKIQFIIAGWHYNQESLFSGLKELNDENDNVSVFYSCHREPIEFIKENFDWKLFPNLGLGDGAYQQAIEFLKIDDETICFFLQDDVIIKNWEFINVCINLLDSHKIVGNCTNYPMVFDPDEVREFGPIEEWDNFTLRQYAKESTRHLFDTKMGIKTIRGSFNCIRYRDLMEVGGWEPHYFEPLLREDGTAYYRKEKGIGGLGNVCLILFSYKINRVFGPDSIAYLSERYLDSDYIYECARGKMNEDNPMT